jgi:hypothetical protein
VHVGMHLDFLLACNTVSVVWLTVSLFHTSGMNCLLNIRFAAMSWHDSFTVCKAEAQAQHNECIRSIYQKPNTCPVHNCMAYNAAKSQPVCSVHLPVESVSAAGAGPTVHSTPAPLLEREQPATGKIFLEFSLRPNRPKPPCVTRKSHWQPRIDTTIARDYSAGK